MHPHFRINSADGDACFAVENHLRGRGWLELELVEYRRHSHHIAEETLERIGAAWLERFPETDGIAWEKYATHLESAARHAAVGELGYFVAVERDGDNVRVELVHRDFVNGEFVTNAALDKSEFAAEALVEANEYAAELRAKAADLNSQASIDRRNAYEEKRAALDDAYAREAATVDLKQIVAEENSDRPLIDI